MIGMSPCLEIMLRFIWALGSSLEKKRFFMESLNEETGGWLSILGGFFVVYLFLILGFRIAWYDILMMLKHLPVLNGEYMYRSESDDAKECVLKKGQDLEMEFPSDIMIYTCLASCM